MWDNSSENFSARSNLLRKLGELSVLLYVYTCSILILLKLFIIKLCKLLKQTDIKITSRGLIPSVCLGLLKIAIS